MTVEAERPSLALVPVTDHPYNAETPLAALAEPLTPTRLFYVRSNFAVPVLDLAAWRLTIDGVLDRPETLTWEQLRGLPERTVSLTMECAGNGRHLLRPMPSGTPWKLGAVSTASFTGVSLHQVLERAGVRPEAREVIFFGADGGQVDGVEVARFARSLPLLAARDPDVLLAWAINDEPLPPHHGFPLRLVVPGWYGMASVKWLVGIHVTAEAFHGHFQTERYVYLYEEGTPDRTPVTRMRVRSLIARPGAGESVPLAPIEIEGCAWSGHGRISRVEVSTDGGATWSDASLGESVAMHAATPWSFRWTPPCRGAHELISRATDFAGNRQPLDQVWNEQGYGNNVVQRVSVNVERHRDEEASRAAASPS